MVRTTCTLYMHHKYDYILCCINTVHVNIFGMVALALVLSTGNVHSILGYVNKQMYYGAILLTPSRKFKCIHRNRRAPIKTLHKIMLTKLTVYAFHIIIIIIHFQTVNVVLRIYF